MGMSEAYVDSLSFRPISAHQHEEKKQRIAEMCNFGNKEASHLQQASPAYHRLFTSDSPVKQHRDIYKPETQSVEHVQPLQPPIQQDNYHRQLQFNEYDTVIPSTNNYQVGTYNIQSGVKRVQPRTLQSQTYVPSPKHVPKPQIGSTNQQQGINRVQQPILTVKRGEQLQQQHIVDIVLGEALLIESNNQSLRQTVDVLGVSLRRTERLRKDNFCPQFLKRSATIGKAFYTKFSGYAKIAEWRDEQKRELCWCLDDAASHYAKDCPDLYVQDTGSRQSVQKEPTSKQISFSANKDRFYESEGVVSGVITIRSLGAAKLFRVKVDIAGRKYLL
ncbi:Hypothetical predicted protein [Mytilus galloprovincialis]|uniref:Uncharacterized protein n=1 Tax=Mytilus galloprovincialis TaxID=29158 RepID=A0A8B6DLE5_MYTGA|nr:Hypothetical predicted protein [Mytilus galloprovincialis]